MAKLQGGESLSKEYMCFWQNFRKKGKKVPKGGAKDFFNYLVGETHKGRGKFSGGGTNPGGNYEKMIAPHESLFSVFWFVYFHNKRLNSMD